MTSYFMIIVNILCTAQSRKAIYEVLVDSYRPISAGSCVALPKEICIKRLVFFHPVPVTGPDIIAYNNTNSTSIYVEWVHSIPQRDVRGVLLGYRVAWDEDYFSSGDDNDSEGYVDVGLDTSNYNVSSLHEYWLYNIRVAGRTSVGPGAYTTVTVRTGEDGKTFTTFSERIANLMHPFENCRIFLAFLSKTSKARICSRSFYGVLLLDNG